jgi:hypothetical protein
MHIARETAGAARIRSSLRPLFLEGQRNAKLRAHRAARSLGMSHNIIASEAKQSIAPRKRRMDCFVASLLAMTAFPGPRSSQTPAFQFCNRSHVDIDIPVLAPAI